MIVTLPPFLKVVGSQFFQRGKGANRAERGKKRHLQASGSPERQRNNSQKKGADRAEGRPCRRRTKKNNIQKKRRTRKATKTKKAEKSQKYMEKSIKI